MNKRKIVMAISLLSLSIVNFAHADSTYCAPSVGSGIVSQAVQRIAEDKANIENMSAQHKAEIDASNSSFSCSDVWSAPSVSVSFQNVVDLLKKAGEAAVSKACTAAKEKISEATASASQSASLNTSNIPGLSSLGLGTVGNVSTSSSSTSGISVNGSNTTWSQISQLTK